MKILRHFAATFLALLCLPAPAEARRPMGTTMTGVVRSVDHFTRWIILAQDGGPLRTFVYTTQAKLWNGKANTRPSLIRPGMRIQINLHNPLFGADFVRQIKLIEADQDKARAGRVSEVQP